MQGERASIGSLSETLNFEHGSTSSNAVIDTPIHWESDDFMISAADTNTNTTFPNSLYHEQRSLHRFTSGEASSSGTKNEAASSHSEQWMQIGRFEEQRNGKLELNPLFMQPSSSGGNRVVRNVNLNAEYNEHLEDANPVTGHPSLFQVNGITPENSVRAGSSADGRLASRKRKALDAGIGQSSSSGGGFREFHRGESSSWVSTPVFYSPASNDLNISLDHGQRGLISGTVPNLSAPAITESSSRNFSARVNPTAQQETVSPSVFSAGSVIRRPVAPSSNSPGLLPLDQQQLIDFRYRHGYGGVTPVNTNGSAIRMPSPALRNMIPPFQWSGSPVVAGGSSSSASPVNGVRRDETRERSNILENPLFVPAPEQRNPAQRHISRNASGARHVASSSSSSRTSGQPSPSTPAWSPYQNNPTHAQRRLTEQFRRSLLSSIATNQRAAAARSSVPPASPDEQVPQPGGDYTYQALNRAYARAGPRQGQTAVGVPHSLRGVAASTSRGRSRLAASEIRSVLDHMRRGGNLRIEDVMLLNQSMLGGADIHDRYRDMRLDVDNMSYEELLSLEERIGDVCTGLKDETISNRLKEQKYKRSTQDVEPCCICQEEYKEGEDMGTLECGHDFHSPCIKEWLKVKNLCPICKTTGLNTAEKPRR